MRIAVLSDNRTHDPKFETEHGLSVYAEWKNKKWLLDTGKSDMFMRNAERLHIDLADVDYLFLSHGHNDHTGGLPYFLEKNMKAKVLVSKNAFFKRLYSMRAGKRDISMPDIPDEMLGRIIQVHEYVKIEPDVAVFTSEISKYPTPVANRALFCDRGLGLEHDDFSHELVIAFGNDEPLIYVGCGHKGLLNIMESCKEKTGSKPGAVFGGFHFPDATSGEAYEAETDMRSIARTLDQEYGGTRFYTGHCTGDKSFEILKTETGDRIELFYTGFDHLINE
jgi:7,8-dihydropterin-6-yl-methyl-4-(beta-D-ribofuranosyl)aminobenzene 5'-phosphate synthase